MERNPRTLQVETSGRENANPHSKLRLWACFEAKKEDKITIDTSDYNFQCRRVSCQISASINEAISKSIENRIVIGKTFPTTVAEPKAICHDTEKTSTPNEFNWSASNRKWLWLRRPKSGEVGNELTRARPLSKELWRENRWTFQLNELWNNFSASSRRPLLL